MPRVMVVEASAPCRIDMGGTLDIPGFYLMLRHLEPMTVNMALKLRTRVRVTAFRAGSIRIGAEGIETAEFSSDRFPYHHPLGLMAAVVRYFNIDGVGIEIVSESPPRSGLGGSSVAAVALAQALAVYGGVGKAGGALSAEQVADIARSIEAAVAGVPCGGQDHLAAAFGGVHFYHWGTDLQNPGAYRYTRILDDERMALLSKRMLLVYTGAQHVSGDINARWVRDFMRGEYRGEWSEIVRLTRSFAEALSSGAIREAAALMNREVALRRKMTPQVLNSIGEQLVEVAQRNGCGARFTGAGAGGCLWALGEEADIQRLEPVWREIVSSRENGKMLPVKLDAEGVSFKRLT